MAEIIPITPTGRLHHDIREALQSTGHAYAILDELPVTAEVWRSTARRAAHTLGRPVPTVLGDDAVHAILRNWPRDDHERAISADARRRAVNAVAGLHD